MNLFRPAACRASALCIRSTGAKLARERGWTGSGQRLPTARPVLGVGCAGFDRFTGFAGPSPNQPGKPQPTCFASQLTAVSNIQNATPVLDAVVPTSRGLVGDVRQTFSYVVRHRPRSRRELVKQL